MFINRRSGSTVMDQNEQDSHHKYRRSGSTVMDQNEQNSHHKYKCGSPAGRAMLTKACFAGLPACFARGGFGQTSYLCFSVMLWTQ